MWDEHTGPKLRFLLRLSGWLLLRLAARAFSVLLYQEPPSNTRGAITGDRCRVSGDHEQSSFHRQRGFLNLALSGYSAKRANTSGMGDEYTGRKPRLNASYSGS